MYHAAMTLATPLAPAALAWRLHKGKENRARLAERMGQPSRTRPRGPLAWLHGASVGEGLALLPLVDQLIERGFHVLVTTGTVTSADVLAARLPPRACHQFVPLDCPSFINRFLAHWQPDLTLIAESEIWPVMINQLHARHIPLVLVNGRMSPRSYARWQKCPQTIAALLSKFDLCLAQTEDDATRLIGLGAPRVQVAGNLKYDVPAPPVDSTKLAQLSAIIGSRPLWVAASTHNGEEELIVQIHKRVAQVTEGLLTIIVPRHPQRGPEIAALAQKYGIAARLRSHGAIPDQNSKIYIADTIGELGLFYRLSGVVFVGKSLMAEGGQNPIEPAKLGCAILHGPHVNNFAEVYRELDASRGAAQVGDGDTLARALVMLLSDAGLLRKMARASSDAVEQLSGATLTIMTALEPYFMQMKVENN
jgi:3-deoxy-D-manno-octulosonic-acid transferase